MQKAIFKSTSKDFSHMDGIVHVLRELTNKERDPEVGRMFKIKAINAKEKTDAFADELTFATKVIFRRFKGGRTRRGHTRAGEGQTIALFPYEIATKDGMIQSYMHIGQHSPVCPTLIHDTKPATPEQYADLKVELESLGYLLDIKKRVSWSRYNKVRRTACI